MSRRLLLRTVAGLAAIASLTGGVVVSCSGDPLDSTGTPGDNRPSSHALGQWQPDTRYNDECPQSLHDSYFVVAPDGKKYPTWHPPSTIDPDTGETCYFGHEHGQDPQEATLWSDVQRHFAFDANGNAVLDDSELEVSGVPFGYVAEQLDTFSNTQGRRWQSHDGYKIAYANGRPRFKTTNGATIPADHTCDVLIAHHQSTDDEDAFASNLHQVTYAIDCKAAAGTTSNYAPKLIVSAFATFGDPGGFLAGPIDEGASTTFVAAGTPVPSDSPPGGGERGRLIADTTRVFDNVFVLNGQTSNFTAGLTERWTMALTLRRDNSSELAFFDPAFDVELPARFWDGALRNSIDLCYSGLNASGQFIDNPALASTIVRQVRNSTVCAFAPAGPNTLVANRLAFDAITSPFNGCTRHVRVNNQRVLNAGGPTVWYTDPFGQGARTTPFAGSVKQFVAQTDTSAANLTLTTAVIDVNVCGLDSRVHVIR